MFCKLMDKSEMIYILFEVTFYIQIYKYQSLETDKPKTAVIFWSSEVNSQQSVEASCWHVATTQSPTIWHQTSTGIFTESTENRC